MLLTDLEVAGKAHCRCNPVVIVWLTRGCKRVARNGRITTTPTT